MRWLTRLLSASRPPRGFLVRRRRFARLGVEPLEERTLLNNRFVVPFGVAADNVTTFRTLENALTTTGIQPGDVIQIEPGSSPGSIVNANLPAVANVTIQGDPAVGLIEIPAFLVNDAVTVGTGQDGFTLKNVNVFLQGGGLTFDVNGTITMSNIANNFAGPAITLNGTMATTILNSQIIEYNGVVNGTVIQVNTAANSNNLISGNTIIGTGNTRYNLLSYSGANTVSDSVNTNVFKGDNQHSAPLFAIDTGINGLGIHGNRFETNNSQTAIFASGSNRNLAIIGNAFNLSGAGGAIGIDLGGGPAGTTTSATISLNRFSTNAGIAVNIVAGSPGSHLNVKMEGNGLFDNAIGVNVDAGAGGSVAGIDLGGGSQGSLGGNNFRGMTNAATATSGAIVTNALAAAGTISAQKNLFSVPDPETVIFDANDNATLADVDPSGNLTGNAAYVQTLYVKFLHRVGDTSNPSDAGFWVTQLNNHLPAFTVANAIVRSVEALTSDVDGLYRKYLNRAADSAGEAAFVNFLQHGGTLEQVSDILLTSSEYTTIWGSAGAYALSLYYNLLGRMPSTAELNNIMAAIPALGRAAVANIFLHSVEYRADIVTGYYVALLDTSNPAPADVVAWANSPFDLLTIQVFFAASPGFQTNG